MIRKSRIIESLSDMPEEISIDELVEKLIVIQKVEEGLTASKEGKVYSEEEAKKLLGKWLK